MEGQFIAAFEHIRGGKGTPDNRKNLPISHN